MSIDRYKKLEEKYWNGELSIEEESILRESEHISPELLAYFESMSQFQLKDQFVPFPKKNVNKVRRLQWIRSIAASLVLLVITFILMKNDFNSRATALNLEETQAANKAFALLENNINRTFTISKQSIDQIKNSPSYIKNKIN